MTWLKKMIEFLLTLICVFFIFHLVNSLFPIKKKKEQVANIEKDESYFDRESMTDQEFHAHIESKKRELKDIELRLDVLRKMKIQDDEKLKELKREKYETEYKNLFKGKGNKDEN